MAQIKKIKPLRYYYSLKHLNNDYKKILCHMSRCSADAIY